MAEYYVIAPRGESESSDTAFKNAEVLVEGTKALEGIRSASIVLIEAGSEEAAREAFRALYPGRANVKPLVCTKANLT